MGNGEGLGKRGDVFGLRAETAFLAGDDGAVGIAVQIHHRPEIHVEAEMRQLGRKPSIDIVSRQRIVARADLLSRRIGLKALLRREPLDDAALLIHREQHGDVALGAL
jgi:hypothetical protein